MTKPIRLIVNLPFAGFYETNYSHAVDGEEERYVEYAAEENDSNNDDSESNHPPELRLTAGELGEIIFRHTSYSDAYQTVARDYVESFNDCAKDLLGLDPQLEFEKMTSPREYNFETDRIFAFVPLKVMRELYKRSKAEKHATLGRIIAERFTSRSGFISHYQNELDSWLAKPLADWDHNELGTLLLAALELAGAGPDCRDFRDDVEARCLEGDGVYSAWSNAVDWTAYEAAREDARADKIAEARDRDPLAFPDHRAAPYRCPLTLDLFRDRQH